MSRRAIDLVVTGGLVLMVLAALGVATGDAVPVWTDGPSTVTLPDDEPIEAVVDEVIEPGTSDAPPPSEPTDVFVRVIAVLGGALLVWLFVVVALTWWRIWRERERRGPAMGPTSHLEALAAPRVALSSDELAETLRHGESRNAIVACWVLLEEAVAAAGHPRRPAETSVEYTERVLGTDSGLDPAAVRRLAELYREARFSSHPLGEQQRAAALEALGAVTR